MDFITYLKRVIDDFKSIGSEGDKEGLKAAKEEYAEYLKKYKSDIPNKTYQRLETDLMSDEEINNAAKQEYDAWLENQTSKLESDYLSNVKKEEIKKSAALDDLSLKESNLEKDFEDAKQKNHNDSVKRGIARSSIAAHQSKKVEDNMADSTELLRQKFLNESARIDESIKILEDKRNAALSGLDYEYAKQIDAKVKKLKNERESKEQQIIKYNNQLAQTESKEQKEEIDAKKSQDLYRMAESLLAQMNSTDAKQFILSKELKDSLSGYHYYTLYRKYA